MFGASSMPTPNTELAKKLATRREKIDAGFESPQPAQLGQNANVEASKTLLSSARIVSAHVDAAPTLPVTFCWYMSG